MKFQSVLIPAVLLTVSGGLLAWLMLTEPPAIQENTDAETNRGRIQENSRKPPLISGDIAEDPKPGIQTAAPLPDHIRNVSPDGVSAPRVSGSLKRIEPSKRYLELKNPPVEAIPDGPLDLRQVRVLDSGHIRSGQLTVKLAHILPLEPDENCVSRLGGTWPCGARAQTFLKGLVRQFKITCEKLEVLEPQHILASCSKGNINLSSHMIRYGWADAAPNAPSGFHELAREAKEKKIGKWQSEWLADLPASSLNAGTEAILPGLEELTPEIVEWSLRADPGQRVDDDLPESLNIAPVFPQQ